MHTQVKNYIARMKQLFPEAFAAKKIVEAGSLDMNGNPRIYFDATEYVGVDWREGPGVEEVALFQNWKGRPDGHFDMAISTEMMEHNPMWRASIRRMVELVRPGGYVLITCAGVNRPIHEQHTSPGVAVPGLTSGVYYENRTVAELVAAVLDVARFAIIVAEDEPGICDSRVFAVSKLAEPC